MFLSSREGQTLPLLSNLGCLAVAGDMHYGFRCLILFMADQFKLLHDLGKHHIDPQGGVVMADKLVSNYPYKNSQSC